MKIFEIYKNLKKNNPHGKEKNILDKTTIKYLRYCKVEEDRIKSIMDFNKDHEDLIFVTLGILTLTTHQYGDMKGLLKTIEMVYNLTIDNEQLT